MAHDDLSAFHQELLNLLPRLRAYARALAGSKDSADDLVQGAILQALSQRDKFEPGSNLGAWIFRIQRNLFIDRVRRQRPTEELDEAALAPTLSCKPSQDDAVLHKEFLRAFARLPAIQREALVLSVIEGQSYEQIAGQLGVAVGTIKSRVCRARDRLTQDMMGDDEESVLEPGHTRRYTARDGDSRRQSARAEAIRPR